jgi:hypothetical protein
MVKPFRFEFEAVEVIYLFDPRDELDASHLKEIELMEEIAGGGHQR